MKTFFIAGTVLAMAVANMSAQSMPDVAVSGKMISASAPTVTFTITNPSQDIAKTHVFSMAGKEVAELSAESTTRFVWDGKDLDQQDVEAGLYVVQITDKDGVWHGPIFVNR